MKYNLSMREPRDYNVEGDCVCDDTQWSWQAIEEVKGDRFGQRPQEMKWGGQQINEIVCCAAI